MNSTNEKAQTTTAWNVGQAMAQTLWHVVKRLPVFAAAVIACWGLFWLDSYKQGYDRSKKTTIEVYDGEDGYITRLGRVLTSKPHRGATSAFSEKEWTGKELDLGGNVVCNEESGQACGGLKGILKLVQGRSFASGGDLMAALEAAVHGRKNEIVMGLKEERARLDAAHSPGTERATERKKITDRIAAVEQAAAAQLELVRRLRPSLLEPASVNPPQAPVGVFYPMVERWRLLDKDSDVYVFYQMLWLTFVAVIVFSLIFVVSKVIRALYAAADAEKFREKAEELITAGRGAAGREVSKSAVISLATLGMATAGVAVGAAVNSKAERALVASQYAAESPAGGGRRGRGPNDASRLPPAPATPTPSPTPGADLTDSTLEGIRVRLDRIDEALRSQQQGDLTQVQQTLQDIKLLVAGGRSQPTPTPALVGLPEFARGMNNHSAGLLKFAEGFTVFSKSLDGYSANLGEHAKSLNSFSESMKTVSGSFAECCRATGQVTTGPSPQPATTPSPSSPPTPTPTPTPPVPEAPATRPKGPNFVSRVLGREQLHRVTAEAYQSIAAAMSSVDVYGNRRWADGEAWCILRALQRTSSRPPLGRKQFREEVEKALRSLGVEARAAPPPAPPAAGSAGAADAASPPQPQASPPGCQGLHRDPAQVLDEWWKIILERTHFNN